MDVKQGDCSVFRKTAFFLILAGALAAHAQNPTSAQNPFYGSVTAQPLTDQTLKLSLDDAIRRGLENNLGLREAQAQEKSIKGQRDQALQEFLPTITLTGDTGFYQHDLVALGFSPTLIDMFAPLFPGGVIPPGFSGITRDTLTEGMIHYNQTLFSGPVISGWRAAGAAQRSAYYAKMTARGQVVQDVATIYLRAIADSSEVDNARANVDQAQLLYNNAHDEHVAGTVANLDELRAKVELQSQQQTLINAQNTLDKDLILLKRQIGIDPGQKITLTDAAPYADLAEQTLPELLAIAYQDRQDYQNLQNQVTGFKAIHSSYRSQRWPSLTFSGYYGVQNVTTVGAHGVMSAQGQLSFPIFREPGLRGGEDASLAQLNAARADLDDLHNQIEEQLRAAQLDVTASKQLVDVSRSNVDLATRELSDATDRVKAGVDTNLPLVTAQASLANAQSSLVASI
jgi:outer membrane protein TolC